MTRIERLRPTQLDADQQALYAQITEGPRARGPQRFALTAPDGSLNGPFNALLLAPALGAALQEVGAGVRYGTTLPDRVREGAILLVAAHWSSGFERVAHEAVGADAGLSPADLGALADGRVPDTADAYEAACLELTRLLIAGDVVDDDWTRLGSVIDARAVFELTTLVGYYATLALQLRVFRVDSGPASSARTGAGAP